LVVTTVTPEKGAIEFVARLEAMEGGKLPRVPRRPNMCWQLRSSPAFRSKGDYSELVRREFVFMKSGLTFLDKTTRLPNSRFKPDHRRNSPMPHVQRYRTVDTKLPAQPQGSMWAPCSPDQILKPIIGAVSRDREYLVAIASRRAGDIINAYHDCMHNGARWETDKKTGAQIWRVRIYAMKNDPDALLARYEADFGTHANKPAP
jgi:hypothetical protein